MLAPNEQIAAMANLKPETITTAAPLWLGAIEQIDDLVPSVVGLFDLVIIDEASQVDQFQAAPILVRAQRALLFGDPQQIGHKSPTTAEVVTEVAAKYGLDPSQVNAAEDSIFEMAMRRVPTEPLDEQFRSAPHLIEFSARRFYQGGLHTVLRRPSNEAADNIGLRVVKGQQNALGVNDLEVEECLRFTDDAIKGGWRSIGIVSPIEAQANAIGEAVSERYPELPDPLSIRTGTVAEFQGDEVDLMVISCGVGGERGDAAWSIVNEPRSFNVMVTRARWHVEFITSDPNPPGLAGEYVKWCEPLSDLVRDEPINEAWVQAVAEHLRSRNIPVRVGYRAGRYVIDIVAGRPDNPVAIDCRIDPEGIDTHIDKATTLRRIGWATADAYELKWRYRLDHLAGELMEKFPQLMSDQKEGRSPTIDLREQPSPAVTDN